MSWEPAAPARRTSSPDDPTAGAYTRTHPYARIGAACKHARARCANAFGARRHYVAKEIACLGDKYRPAAASYALHETRLMYLLRHPHIVQLRDFYPKSSSYFIVMEYCEQVEDLRRTFAAPMPAHG